MNANLPPPIDEKDPEQSYLRILPELLALPRNRVRRVNEAIPRAVKIVLGALQYLRALRPRIDALPEFDATVLDRIEDYALCLLHAHTIWLSTTEPRDDLPALLQEAVSLKDRFLHDAQALAHRGLIDPSKLQLLTEWDGYAHVATDLGCLQKILEDDWDRIEGQSAVTLDELAHAEKLALRMNRLRGQRMLPEKSSRDQAADIRARAYTVLVNAYEQARRAVDFLLWDDPQRASVTPTLYRGRPRKGQSKTVRKESGVA